MRSYPLTNSCIFVALIMVTAFAAGIVTGMMIPYNENVVKVFAGVIVIGVVIGVIAVDSR